MSKESAASVYNSGSLHPNACRAAFFASGLVSAAWASMIPFLKLHLMIDEAVLGILLLCIGLGGLASMPFSGRLVSFFGCQRLLLTVSSVLAVLLMLLCDTARLPVCAVLLLFFGVCSGILDVSINIFALHLENLLARRLMSGMHGMWSLGTFAGAGGFSLFLQTGFTVYEAILCMVLLVLFLTTFYSRYVGADIGRQRFSSGGDSRLSLPKGVVVWLGVAACIAFQAESTLADWGGLFLVEVRGFELSVSSLGFSLFSAAMLLMRLSGDRVIQRLGEKPVVFGGTCLAILGFLLLLLVPLPDAALTGFFLIGVGAANTVPVIFSIIGRQKAMTLNTAMSAVGTIGYCGSLTGPALIGFAAQQISLLFSFTLLLLLLIVLQLLLLKVYRSMKP